MWRENKLPLRDLKKVMYHCDVLTLNEAGHHYDAIRQACGTDWYFIHAEESGFNQRQNVILARKSVFALSEVPTALELMCEATNGTPPRFLLTKRLVHRKAKRALKVRVTHMNSHVENPQWWRLARWEQYARHSRSLRRTLRHSRGTPTVQLLGMDCNANYRKRFVRSAPLFPYSLLRTVRARCSYAVLGMPRDGTKGRRLIDGIWMMTADFCRFVSQRVITGLQSDHNAVVVTIRIR